MKHPFNPDCDPLYPTGYMPGARHPKPAPSPRPKKLPVRPVIFLDFDGVLIPRSSYLPPIKIPGQKAGAHPDCVAALNWLIEQTGARIVVSSSWRLQLASKKRQHDYLHHLMQLWGVAGRLAGQTPHLSSLSEGGVWMPRPRGAEIQAWLDQHPEVQQFVILDDDGDMEHLSPHLARTTFAEGLTMERAAFAYDLMALLPRRKTA